MSHLPNLSAGAAIAYARRRADLSARRVSLDAGLSDSYVGKVEAGDILPGLRAFARIAAVLGLTDAELVLIVRAEADLPMPKHTRQPVGTHSVSHPVGRMGSP